MAAIAISRAGQPELHALVDDVARAAGVPAVDALLLDLDPDAALLERRGRRVLLLGLPLLAVLGRDELRAVVAHELGHTTDWRAPGRRLWLTRAAALRALDRLEHLPGPVHRAARTLVCRTGEACRRQELAADALSARVTSPEAAGRALRRIAAVAPTYDGFWEQDVAPMLAARRRPPLAEGFARLAGHTELATTLDAVLEADLGVAEPAHDACHPTLGRRLAALGVALDPRVPDPPEDPALGLLRDVAGLEQALLAGRFGAAVRAFLPAGWDAAGPLHVADRRRLVSELPGVVPPGTCIADAGHLAGDLTPLRHGLRARTSGLTEGAIDHVALDLLSAHVVVAAADAGAAVTALPGEPLRIHHAGAALDVWEALAERAAFDDDRAASPWSRHPVVEALAAAPLVGLARPAAAAA